MSLPLALMGAGALRAPMALGAASTGVPTAAAPAVLPVAANPAISTLTETACPPNGGVLTCELWAKAGSVTLPPSATSVTVWSFVGSSGDSVSAPVGPTLVLDESQQPVNIVLHNQIAGQNVSLSMPQIDDFPEDFTGAAPNDDATYVFTPSRPGTFLYEAGGTSDGARQAAMGLIGALVVLPSPADGTAYGTPNTAFTDQGVVVMSDIDPGLNASPMSYDMRNFAPRYHLFNGHPYPDTAPIPVNADDSTLLRLVNGGVVQHALGVMGTTQMVVAESGRPLSHPYGVAAENVSAGDTMDMIVTIPAAPGLKYAVYDPSMRLDNNGAASSAGTGNIVSFGGGLTFLQASGDAPAASSPPEVSGLSVSPTRVGTTPTSITFNATVTDDVEVQAVEYVLDDAGAAEGSGTPVTITPAPVVTLTSVPVDVSALATGTHQLLVRGKDADGWGALLSVSFKVDKTGPNVTGITPAASAVNGSGPLAFSGSISDVGGGSVASATWKLDNGGADPLTLTPVSGPTVALSGSVAAATLQVLTEGLHYLSATATDDLGNVGPAGPAGSPVGAAFLVDMTGPTAGSVAVTPSPNNGSQGVSYDPTSIEVRSTPYADGGSSPSGVVSGEGFIGTVGANGSGFPMVIYAPTQSLVATIPLSQLTSLPNGSTTIYVHAKDKAGNWGAMSTGTLVMDRSVTVSGLSVTPASTSTATTVALAGTATASAGQTIAGAEYYVDTDPGVGNGTAMTLGPAGQSVAISATVPVAARTVGAHTIGVRARDANGTWGPATTITFTLASLFTDGFETAALPGPWQGVSTQNGGTANRLASNAMSGAYFLQVGVSGPSSQGYVSTPATTAVPIYHMRFQVNPNTLVTGSRWVSIGQAMGGSTERFRVEYMRNGAGTPQVRLVVRTGNGNGTTTSVARSLNANATNTIRVDWTSAASATVSLTVNAGPPLNMTGLNTNNRTVTSGRLGISLAASSGSGTYSGAINLDAFDSARYTF